jgi:hypothetical protein
MTWRLSSLPYWVLVAIQFALTLPILLAVPAAVLGPGHSAFSALGGLGGIIGGSIGQRSRQRDYWALARPLRLQVTSAVVTGSTTGDPNLDRIAISRLEERVRNRPADRWILPPVAILCVSVPLIAAYRTVWPWALAELSTLAILGLGLPRLLREDPRARLDRLGASMTDALP